MHSRDEASRATKAANLIDCELAKCVAVVLLLVLVAVLLLVVVFVVGEQKS